MVKQRDNTGRRFLNQLRIAAFAALYAGCSTWTGLQADDTQIYVNKVPAAQTPNVLFTIDTSGSMAETVPGSGGQSRMDAVKEALTGLINNTGNLKAGLGRFHTFIGGSIIFPVRDINKTIGNEEPFPDTHSLTVAVDRSTDDAEQNVAAGTFSTDDPVLELTEVNEPVSGYGFVTPQDACFVPKDTDDDDEHGESGSQDLDSPDLDIGDVNAGIRFFDVNIPENAIILHAEVEFTASTSDSDPASALIRGHNVGNSPWFVNDPVTHQDAVTPRIDDEATNASVSWGNIRDVSSGDKVTTPNIRTIVQEIVQHSGWSNGNPLTILFEAQGGQRELTSLDGDPGGDCDDDVPKLRVTYVEENEAEQFSRQPVGSGDDIWEADNANDQDVNPDHLPLITTDVQSTGFCFPPFIPCTTTPGSATSGVRFPNITIPDGAAVLWADIEFTAQEQNNSTLRSMRIRGVEEANPGPFDESNREPSDLDTTFDAVTWDDDTVTYNEEIFAPAAAGRFRTPNLDIVLNEIIGDTGFASGNHMAFLIDDAGGSGENEQVACSVRATQQGLGACPEGPDAKPTLRVFYELPTTVNTSHQQVGLRFNEVNIPQGAEITSAVLELSPETTSSQETELTIAVENNANPDTFSTANPVNRGGWTGGESWTVGTWQEGETVASADISGLVQTVTNRTDWCGGQSLAFRISGDDAALAAQSFDSGSGNAPRLRVNYRTDSLQPGEGCVTSRFVTSVTDAADNVFENQSGNVRNDAGELRLDNQPRTVGLRFDEVDIPQGSLIRSASLELTANRDQTNSPSTVTIRSQSHPNPPSFSLGNTADVTGRNTSGASVTWSAGPWDEGEVYSPDDDLSGLIQSIVDGSVTVDDQEWASGNALAFILEGGSHRLDIEQCCGTGETPPKLVIDYEVDLGDVIERPVKELLLSTIDSLLPGGNTPFTDALYESGAYFSGAPVHFGRTRGAGASYDGNDQEDDDIRSIIVQSWWDDNRILDYNDSGVRTGNRNTRLSHPATYGQTSGGTDADIIRTGDCSEDNLDDYDCRRERIDNNQSVDYISPFSTAESCERGFLVMLSDGLARDNSSRQLIRDLSGAPSCNMDIPRLDDDTGEPLLPDGSTSFVDRDPTTYEQCGLELANHLHDEDFIQDGSVDDEVNNNVRTFTIGFNLNLSNTTDRNAVEYLKALAFVGNGGDLDNVEADPEIQYGDGFYLANTADELRSVFEDIVGDIIKETTSFVAPGISINAVNRLYHLNDIYYSLFRPANTAAWLGNLKKFKLCEADQDGCKFGEVVDEDGNPAVHDDEKKPNEFGTLRSEVQDVWSEDGDDTTSAPEINQGGAGEKIPTYAERNVYMNTDSDPVTPPDYDSGAPPEHGTSLHALDLDSDVGAAPASGNESDFNDLKSALLSQGNCATGDIDDKNSCLNDLIEWIAGKKFPGDVSRDGTDEDEDRWAFGDPMHSRPLILTYGLDSDDDSSFSKIFVGTNDGGIRMLNDSDGVEEWIFYPNAMLGMQSGLKENPNGTHLYGVDGTPTVRINDEDDDFIIEPGDGDFVHLYIGMRRGGRQLIAVNVTPDDIVTGPDDKGLVEPEILWRIDGSSDADFQRLGDTWSTPRTARVQTATGSRTVLIFGGGYDDQQDGIDDDTNGDSYNTSTTGDAQGNAIFMVDADTGERLWWASSDSNADTVVSEMNTSIAAPVTLVDSNQDSHVDRLYAVDLRGQVFRADIATSGTPSSVGLLATLGPDPDDPDSDEPSNEDRRKFFYAPEVARVNDTVVVEEPYDLIGIVSGNRSNPQGKTVLDRAYAIRDFLIDNPSEGLSSSNFPACNPRPDATDCPTSAITHSHLKDVTDKGDFVIREEQENGTLTLTDPDGNEPPAGVLEDLQQSHGWFFDLEGDNFDVVGDPDDPTTGEKGFSAATVLDGKMFFTTYLPPEDVEEAQDACSVPGTLGTSRFYAIDFFTGAPAFDRNADTSFDKAERFKNVGPGPSSEVTVINSPAGSILHVPTRQGSTPEDPGFTPEFNKTFWQEDR